MGPGDWGGHRWGGGDGLQWLGGVRGTASGGGIYAPGGVGVTPFDLPGSSGGGDGDGQSSPRTLVPVE